MRFTMLSLLAAIAASGCTRSDGDGPDPERDAGPTADAPVREDASNPACGVDTACPESPPVWGGPCEGTLSCPFMACGPGGMDIYECVGSEWALTMPEPCVGGSPPLAESCRTPFAGTIAGARVWLSADIAGAPELENGDTVEVVFGPQGAAMVPYRVHVDAADLPSCVEVTTTLSLETMTSAPAAHPVRLRCGSSLRIQDILPELPCDDREYAIGLDVTVAGAGSIELDLVGMGGGCPLGP